MNFLVSDVGIIRINLEKKVYLYFILYIRVNFKWIKGLNGERRKEERNYKRIGKKLW